jgi:CIC family chloride channel protein
MYKGIANSEKTSHAELSEQFATVDLWKDIGRKTLIVAIVSITVWAGCTLMRHLVEISTERIFHIADTYQSENILIGVLVILFIMLIGGILRGLLLLRPAWKDSSGDGVDKALIRYHKTYNENRDDNLLRYTEPTFSYSLRKIVMSILTIGTGGSGGLEAPGVYLGETVAAGWSKFFKRPSADELRFYQLSGIAAAIGTLLAAPLTAAIFAVEIVYAGHILYRKLAYCLIAALIGYTLNNHLLEMGGLFDTPAHSRLFAWQEILLIFIVAVLFSAPAAIAMGPVFRKAEHFFNKFPIVLRTVLGSLITGGIGITIWLLFELNPMHILGMGEETINQIVKGTNQGSLQIWWVLLLAVVAKTFATASTITSGGSAGMLIPSMYMGGLAGAAGFYLLNDIGLYTGTSVAVYVAAGMAAALTSVAGVPLASITFVIEVYGSEYGPAACLACAVCFTFSRRFSLYKLPTRDNDKIK